MRQRSADGRRPRRRTRLAGRTIGMDWSVRTGSRIARLPRILQPVALAVRGAPTIWSAAFPGFTYKGDGLATAHHSPFLEDEEFSELYERTATAWFPGRRVEARWRVWLLTRLARSCAHLEGNFAEFGTYRAGYAFMILSTSELRASQRFFLFDTFAGIPNDRLTAAETASGFGGGVFSDTSVEYVEELLSGWSDQVVVCEGDVFQILDDVETAELSFVHLDLNATAPTKRALDYVYPRLVSGAIVVFDDYGRFARYQEQRSAIEGFFAERPEEVIALPTGQGFVTKA